MPVSPGSRLGPYEIRERLGAGGMGEVFRARDTRLDRTVAIKVLAAHRVSDPDMRQRFEREARAVAALNHPHICHLNDVGHHDGVDFLVMEYLDGETLATRLAKAGKALPLDHTLRYAIDIAEALSAAHQHGIVHRDLKPGNIMLTSAGVKLLDFGLAKVQSVAGGTAASLSTLGATRDNPLTDEGSILGTWPYMAPEQVEGKEADARTDIFAFGAVLYEMATGTRAFEGDSHASLIAAILERDPIPLRNRQSTAPAALDRLLGKCLLKNPDLRWQTARDLADALTWIVEERQSTGQPAAERTATAAVRARRWPWIAAIVTALAISASAAAIVWTPAVPRPQVRRVVIQPGDEDRLIVPQPRFDISADGRALVYTADGGRGRGVSLYLRPLDRWTGRNIPGY